MPKTEFHPRHSYIEVASRRDVLATFVADRTQDIERLRSNSTDGSFSSVFGACHCVALYRYGLGYPLGIVTNDLRGSVGALREMFRRRGTSGSRYYVYVERPAPPDAIARGNEPLFRVAVRENQSDLGTTDYSTTNSRRGFLSVCFALIVGDELAERELVGMIWDPPGASYLSKNSAICTFNDQRVA